MHLNIGQKIFGIALVVLILMAAVAGYSIRLTAEISDELEAVAQKHLPVSEAAAQVNETILEQGILLQRLMLGTQGDWTVQHRDAARSRYHELALNVDGQFRHIENLLRSGSEAGKSASPSDARLEKHYDAIAKEYQALHAMVEESLAAPGPLAPDQFAAMLVGIEASQDRIDEAVSVLRGRIEHLTNTAVIRADRNERHLLVANSILTALAAVFGLGFALIVTRVLVAAVRNLVHGTEAIEAGNLDTEVPVTSHDEVGKLTGSFNRMTGELRLKERIKETFGKYMDPRIVTNLLDHPEFAQPGGVRREMTVMFIDLKGFTSISEKLEPDDLVRMINGFFAHMTEAISGHKGVVDKFMGDAVMAYWGPPFTGPDEHANLACMAAREALDHLDRFRTDVLSELGKDAAELDIDLRIGVSTGEVVVGTVGSKVSMNYTIMGDPVNLGSRLEGANKAYGTRILVSERTRDLVGGDIAVREIDSIRVKGKAEPTRVFELIRHTDGQSLLPSAAQSSFHAGLTAYREQDWDTAAKSFESCLAEVPDDPPAQVFLGRISHLRAAPPPPDWDGVWVFETK